jgi:hypothetical protein
MTSESQQGPFWDYWNNICCKHSRERQYIFYDLEKVASMAGTLQTRERKKHDLGTKGSCLSIGIYHFIMIINNHGLDRRSMF